ncbi:MAG: hypothetical protein U5J83_04895 [Bryobacterales bacterium]|nr:hypothetical protein [Bryobacterales bacterium]
MRSPSQWARFRRKRAAARLLAAASARSDQGPESGERGSSVSGPTLGYVVDASTGNLHMVSGIAGSSTMGQPVHRGGAIRVAAIAPSADYAVVADESGAAWVSCVDPDPRRASMGAGVERP